MRSLWLLAGLALLFAEPSCSRRRSDGRAHASRAASEHQPSASPAARTARQAQPAARAGAKQVACDDGEECSVTADLSPAPSLPAPPPAAVPVARPAPAPPTPAKAKPLPSASKDLEQNPGLTPAPKTVVVTPGPKHPSIEGRPGPSPAMGSEDPLVRVLIFSDFQCPVCRRVVEPLKAVAREFADDVQFIFKHNALEMHRNAADAAAASIAAMRQGKFWEYHDLMFKYQRFLRRPDLIGYARELGLDIAKFQTDMDSQEVRAQVTYEAKLAEALGTRGTPSFFVAAQVGKGWGSQQGFRSLVKRALKKARELAATTPRQDVYRALLSAAGETGQKLLELVWGAK